MNDRLKCYVLTALLFLCVTLRAVEPEGVKRPAILGVSHVTLVVKDLAAARAHYTDLLGFKVMAEVQGDPGSASHVYLRINDYQYYDLVAGGSEDTHVAYQVADAEGMRRYLASKGVEVPTASHIDPLGNPALSVKEAEKRTVEFVQYLTGTLPVKARGTAVSSRQFSRRAFHAAIPVIDFEATRHFYQDILGFSEILKSSYEQAPVWINYRLPEAAVYLELALMDKS